MVRDPGDRRTRRTHVTRPTLGRHTSNRCVTWTRVARYTRCPVKTGRSMIETSCDTCPVVSLRVGAPHHRNPGLAAGTPGALAWRPRCEAEGVWLVARSMSDGPGPALRRVSIAGGLLAGAPAPPDPGRRWIGDTGPLLLQGRAGGTMEHRNIGCTGRDHTGGVRRRVVREHAQARCSCRKPDRLE